MVRMIPGDLAQLMVGAQGTRADWKRCGGAATVPGPDRKIGEYLSVRVEVRRRGSKVSEGPSALPRRHRDRSRPRLQRPAPRQAERPRVRRRKRAGLRRSASLQSGPQRLRAVPHGGRIARDTARRHAGSQRADIRRWPTWTSLPSALTVSRAWPSAAAGRSRPSSPSGTSWPQAAPGGEPHEQRLRPLWGARTRRDRGRARTVAQRSRPRKRDRALLGG